MRTFLSRAALIAVCSSAIWGDPPETCQVQKVFQVSTLDALAAGVFDGALSIRELRQQGNFGVGTYDHLDGEMVALDGRFYRVRADGVVLEADKDDTTPFAAVTHFRADRTLLQAQPADLAKIVDLIDSVLPSRNLFYAIKIHGRFNAVTARSVSRQSPPYPPLANAIAQQSVFPLRDLSGTLVGFRTPAFEKGINQPGYHFHFISDDRRSGGHALAFETSNVVIEISLIREHSTLLPDTPGFLETPLPLP